MPIVPLTPLATPPDPNDRSTFDARAYPFTVSQQTMVSEFNANVTALNDAATAASGALAASHYKGAWSALTGPLAIPATVTHGAGPALYMLLESVADVTAEVPGVSAKWRALAASPLERKPRTANTQLAAGDSGSWIDITANTFTQTFAAASVLGAGWWCYIGNSGTGDVTLDPNAAETIDGLASYVMYPGEMRLVQCDGTTLRTVVTKAFYKTFTASGNFIKPPGYAMFDSLIWSGGSSGQKSGGAGDALGGGGGGCFPATIPAAFLSATTAITVGAGGAARAAAATGALGGDSSIGSLLTVKQSDTYTSGGAVMVGTAAVQSSNAITAPDFGYVTSSAPGCGALWGGGASTAAQPSAGSIYGGGAGGSFSSGSLRTPGASSFGGAGGAGGDAVSGTAGTAPGGGGGGTRTGAQSGAGARGEVRIWGVA